MRKIKYISNVLLYLALFLALKLCLKFEVNTVHITLVVCFIIYEYHSFLPFYSIVLFTLSLNYYLFEEQKSEYSKKGNFCRGKIFSS